MHELYSFNPDVETAEKKREFVIKTISKKYELLSLYEVRRLYEIFENKEPYLKDWGQETFASIYEKESKCETTGEVAMIVISKFDNFYKNMLNSDNPDVETTEHVSVENLRDKYVFWDIDGTLAPYRFNDHVADPDGTNNGMSLKEIEDGVFLYRKPSKHMQRVVSKSEAKENIIMGHCLVEKEIIDKEIWLNRYYPTIKKRMLVYTSESKADTILDYCAEHGIDLQDVVYIDDVIPFLREAEQKGVKSYHISSFLDWDYQ